MISSQIARLTDGFILNPQIKSESHLQTLQNGPAPYPIIKLYITQILQQTTLTQGENKGISSYPQKITTKPPQNNKFPPYKQTRA